MTYKHISTLANGKLESPGIKAMANAISGEKQVISDSFYRRRY